VRYEAGRFGRGFKAEPKSLASVRVVPMCDQVRQAIARQLTVGARPEDLVLPGPGGSNGIPRGARAPLSTTNLRRVYKATVEAAGADLAHLDLRGPHDLRHTFATWLEDAAIPSQVIDELMGHASGRRDGGVGGSLMGRVHRETTPAMVARVTAALDERIGRALAVAAYLLRERRDSRAISGGEGR
jgi:integrase